MAVKVHLTKKTVALGVGDLVAEPAVNVGRVAGLRQSVRLALGRETHLEHQRAQTARHESYATELFVRHATTVDDFAVKIQGRIDGVHPPGDGRPCVIEEVKSLVVPPLVFAALDAKSHPHHLEQLRLYCYLVRGGKAPAEPPGTDENSSAGASPSRTAEVQGQLVYINVVDGTRKEFTTTGPFDDCRELIVTRVRALIAVAVERDRIRHERRHRAAALQFPHEKPRRYQDQMITAVESALEKGRHLLVSAPSGIGKTAGALYPAVKYALANDKRVFFVTAKNTQHAQAAETLLRLDGPSGVVIQAREKMCINSVYACREEFCAHLQMFQLKLQQTRILERLLDRRVILPEALMEAGRGTCLCPFELALAEAERTDAIVCDYNYVFDPQVYFRRFFQDEDYSDAILIIDEAHNLVQRALEYYSPSLSRRQVHATGKSLAHVEPSLAREIRKFLRTIDDYFLTLVHRQPDEYSQVEDSWEGEAPAEPSGNRRGSPGGSPSRFDDGRFLIESPKPFFDDLKPTVARLSLRYLLDKIESGRAIPDDPVEEFFAELGKFYSVLGMEGEEFSYVSDGESVKIVCKDASRQLAERLAGFHSVIAMSATLEPVEFYEKMLGFDAERTDRLALPSPFPVKNRKVLVYHKVSTAFRHRGANYDKIADVIATTVGVRAGNYMALFPSYEFLRSTARYLEMPVIAQEPGMTEAQREVVLAALKSNVPPKLMLAVQGGVFAEGVDYPGETLSGVIVVSPALPTVSFERELMRRYYQEKYGKGFEFAYLYPGMNRVIQSVGRLIRSETDTGVAVLVCQRFAQNQYSALFPSDWSQEENSSLICRDLRAELGLFWQEKPFTSGGNSI